MVLGGRTVIGVLGALGLAACGATVALGTSGRPAAPAHTAAPTTGSAATATPTTNATPAGATNCPAGAATRVASATALTNALAAARPGSVIHVDPGTYAGNFVAAVSGTSQNPIVLCGPTTAILDGGSLKTGYGLYLNGASWWSVTGLTVQDAQKGIVLDHASHVTLAGTYVHELGEEGVHLRSLSTDNLVRGLTVRNTGLMHGKFGEGIYVGSANKNWCRYSSCAPDTSDRNVLDGNDISATTAENIDIKEGTTAGVIANNHLSGDGLSAASAWVNVKGNGWTVIGNSGTNSPKDGFQVHVVYAGWGHGNVFSHNVATVNGPGYGIYVQDRSGGNRVTCDNAVNGAASGATNVGCG